MVGFKNRYMVMEVFVDPSRNPSKDDPINITQFNVSNAIKDSILINFGECGLAASIGSFQGLFTDPKLVNLFAVKYVNHLTKLCIIRAAREEYQKVWSAITMIRTIGNCPVIFNLLDLSGSVRACRNAALKCDKAKFEQYKLLMGDRITPEISQQIHNLHAKIQILEH